MASGDRSPFDEFRFDDWPDMVQDLPSGLDAWASAVLYILRADYAELGPYIDQLNIGAFADAVRRIALEEKYAGEVEQSTFVDGEWRIDSVRQHVRECLRRQAAAAPPSSVPQAAPPAFIELPAPAKISQLGGYVPFGSPGTDDLLPDLDGDERTGPVPDALTMRDYPVLGRPSRN